MTIPLHPAPVTHVEGAPSAAQPTARARSRALDAARTRTRELLYLLSALPLGALWLALVIAGWVATAVLAITPLLPAAVIGFGSAVRVAAWVEGNLARRLLGATCRPRHLAVRRPGYWASVRWQLGDRRFWAGQAFLVLRVVFGLVSAVVVLVVLAAGLEGLLAPVVHLVLPADEGTGIELGFWLVDTVPESLLLVPVGVVVLGAALALLRAWVAVWRGLAEALLGGEDV